MSSVHNYIIIIIIIYGQGLANQLSFPNIKIYLYQGWNFYPEVSMGDHFCTFSFVLDLKDDSTTNKIGNYCYQEPEYDIEKGDCLVGFLFTVDTHKIIITRPATPTCTSTTDGRGHPPGHTRQDDNSNF